MSTTAQRKKILRGKIEKGTYAPKYEANESLNTTRAPRSMDRRLGDVWSHHPVHEVVQLVEGKVVVVFELKPCPTITDYERDPKNKHIQDLSIRHAS